ncbi:MAG: hypothetical protein K0R69_759 [Clostridia bacterium]|jgi:hypothetical protein|nr:hypothetical protein [Clostridia bacterium]
MEKTLALFLALLVALGFIGCNAYDNKEEVAIDFINSYYSQYEKKDDLEELTKSQLYHTKIDAFVVQIFGDLLTEKGKEKLAANRIIPKLDVLDSNINKATASNFKFEEADNYPEGTLSFRALITNAYDDSSESEFEVTGLIRIVDDNEKYRVDNFKITNK